MVPPVLLWHHGAPPLAGNRLEVMVPISWQSKSNLILLFFLFEEKEKDQKNKFAYIRVLVFHASKIRKKQMQKPEWLVLIVPADWVGESLRSCYYYYCTLLVVSTRYQYHILLVTGPLTCWLMDSENKCVKPDRDKGRNLACTCFWGMGEMERQNKKKQKQGKARKIKNN